MAHSQATGVVFHPLPVPVRFYIYALQGFCTEIFFTAVVDFSSQRDWALKGHSSVSSFFIYGLIGVFVEHVYKAIHKHQVPCYLRYALYTLMGYCWEFTTGIILRQFDACPWDYSHYDYNFMGLITFEYAPGWYIMAIYLENLVNYLLRAGVAPSGAVSPHNTLPPTVMESDYQAVPSPGKRTDHASSVNLEAQKQSDINCVAERNGFKTE